MRNLSKEEFMQHVHYQSIRDYDNNKWINVKLCHLGTVEFTGVNSADMGYLILKDENREFFKLDMNMIDNIHLKNNRVYHVDIGEDTYYFWSGPEYSFNDYTNILADTRLECIYDYLQSINLNCTTKISVVSHLGYLIMSAFKKKYNSVIINHIKESIESDSHYNRSSLHSFIKSLKPNLIEVAYEVLPKQKWYYDVIRILLDKRFRFEGSFRVTKMNNNSGYLDTICIDIPLRLGYEENKIFASEYAKAIKTKIVLPILQNHYLCKKYANFMELFDFTLTRDNRIIARFQFKKDLEIIIKGEE